VLIDPLSERETEVLRLIVAGLSNQGIADELIIAESTVKTSITKLWLRGLCAHFEAAEGQNLANRSLPRCQMSESIVGLRPVQEAEDDPPAPMKSDPISAPG